VPKTKHQAKVKKHPATNLPGATPGKQPPAKKDQAKKYLPGVFYRALGKSFAWCFCRHQAKKSYRHGASVS